MQQIGHKEDLRRLEEILEILFIREECIDQFTVWSNLEYFKTSIIA